MPFPYYMGPSAPYFGWNPYTNNTNQTNNMNSTPMQPLQQQQPVAGQVQSQPHQPRTQVTTADTCGWN